MMPPRGAAVRAEQLATLSRITHQKFTAPEIGRLLDELAGFEQEHEHDSFEASLDPGRAPRLEKACKVPSELRAEMSRAGSLALPVLGRGARRTNDFAAFLPGLQREPRAAPAATSTASTATSPSRTTPCSTTTSAA